MLQMPPVKYAKELKPKVLEQDAALQGFLDPSVKLIFMDATPGYSDVIRKWCLLLVWFASFYSIFLGATNRRQRT